jgi:hypothetical protein
MLTTRSNPTMVLLILGFIAWIGFTNFREVGTNLGANAVAATESNALRRAEDGFLVLMTGKHVRIGRGESLAAYVEPDGATILHGAVCHYLDISPAGAFARNESVGYTVTELLPFSGERTLATVTSVRDPNCHT